MHAHGRLAMHGMAQAEGNVDLALIVMWKIEFFHFHSS